jgi:hypothetical protein
LDRRHHERDRLVDTQLLLAYERLPGVEIDRVSDRAGDPPSWAAALAPSQLAEPSCGNRVPGIEREDTFECFDRSPRRLCDRAFASSWGSAGLTPATRRVVLAQLDGLALGAIRHS